jgi:hypothetical protein
MEMNIIMNSTKRSIGLGLLNIARKFMKMISKRARAEFNSSIEEQKKLLNGIKEPNGLFGRSYCQYTCQMSQIPVWVEALLNLLSFFLFPFYMIRYCDNSTYNHKNHKDNTAVFFDAGETENIIPLALKKEFSNIIVSPYNGNMLIGNEEKQIIKQLTRKYKLRPYFYTKCMLKIGIYAYQIRNHNPQAIITASEDSFTVSVLTEYCRYLGIKHINVMHGEKFFNIRDSFVEFDRYYVWDQHYIDLLVELRASKEQFIIESPTNLFTFKKDNNVYKYEYTYYLGAESESDLLKIRENLINLKLPKSELCIRYHPRYSDEKLVSRIFSEFGIENPQEVPINTSIAQTRHIVSLYSTVLYQAYKGGKEIIIDDVTDPTKYIQLRDLEYIMIKKPHIRLSEIINVNY